MLRPLISGGKMVAALVILYFSGAYRFPVILFVIAGWGAWLWIVVPGWKGRLLTTLGLGLTALSWWFVTSLCQYFGRKVEGSHFSEEGFYWSGLAVMAGNLSSGLVIAGILLLTYVDYRRVPKQQQASELSNEVQTEQSHVWPPPPKQPQ